MESEVKERIVEIARERMERECAADFSLLRRFGTPKTRRFLLWIGQIAPGNRLEAALSITSRQLGLMHLESGSPPNRERWVESFLAFPLNAGLDPDWKPRSHGTSLTASAKKMLGPFKVQGPGSLKVSEGSPLFLPRVRTVIELNTAYSDIAVFQFIKEGPREFEISYLGLLGMGQTGWLLGSAEEVEKTLPIVRDVILRAGEIDKVLD